MPLTEPALQVGHDMELDARVAATKRERDMLSRRMLNCEKAFRHLHAAEGALKAAQVRASHAESIKSILVELLGQMFMLTPAAAGCHEALPHRAPDSGVWWRPLSCSHM